MTTHERVLRNRPGWNIKHHREAWHRLRCLSDNHDNQVVYDLAHSFRMQRGVREAFQPELGQHYDEELVSIVEATHGPLLSYAQREIAKDQPSLPGVQQAALHIYAHYIRSVVTMLAPQGGKGKCIAAVAEVRNNHPTFLAYAQNYLDDHGRSVHRLLNGADAAQQAETDAFLFLVRAHWIKPGALPGPKPGETYIRAPAAGAISRRSK